MHGGLPAFPLVLADLGFPGWLRATHWINVFFIGYLVRAGIQILGSYPRLYWNDDSTPGHGVAQVHRRKIPTDSYGPRSSRSRIVPPVLASPGGNNLGLGRHWHFFAVIFWILNGVVYVALLFPTGEWRGSSRPLVHLPARLGDLPDYATFHLPPASEFQPVRSAAAAHLLPPSSSCWRRSSSPPARRSRRPSQARFPWYPKLFGGRQAARSLHFLGLLAFVAFIIVHTALVLITGAGKNFGDIFFGQHGGRQALAFARRARRDRRHLRDLRAHILVLARASPARVQHAAGRVLNSAPPC